MCRPIAFLGYTLSDEELNYTVTEKGALAVVKMLKNTREYITRGKGYDND